MTITSRQCTREQFQRLINRIIPSQILFAEANQSGIMKCVIVAAILICSVAMVLCDTDVIYQPEYEQLEEMSSVRTKRSPHGIDPASLAFLGGVAAGGIFGPLLYNKLYRGNQGGWSAPVVYTQGWEAPSRGW